MNTETENKAPVVEQLNEIEDVEDAIETEYTLTSDGTIEKAEPSQPETQA